MNITKEEEHKLRHCLGAIPSIHRYRWGYRNYYWVDAPESDLESLVTKGLMTLREVRSHVFPAYVYQATPEGMKLAGLTKKAIKECSKESYGRKDI